MPDETNDPTTDVADAFAAALADEAPDDDLRERYLAAYAEHRALDAEAKDARARRDALGEQLISAMLDRNEKTVRLEDGTSITRTERTRYACLAVDRPALLEWAPPELHSVNAQTLAAYCKERAAAGEALPEFITVTPLRGLSVRGLPATE